MPNDFFDDNDRRMPTQFKKIESIEPDDVRVAVIGTVVDSEEEVVVIDDGSGNIEVEFDSIEKTEDFEEGDMVRIIGRPSDEIFYGEFIQDFSDFDIELYQEAKQKLKKKI